MSTGSREAGRAAKRAKRRTEVPQTHQVSLSRMSDYRFETMFGGKKGFEKTGDGITASWHGIPGSIPKHFQNLDEASEYLNSDEIHVLSAWVTDMPLDTTVKPPMTLEASIGFRNLPQYKSHQSRMKPVWFHPGQEPWMIASADGVHMHPSREGIFVIPTRGEAKTCLGAPASDITSTSKPYRVTFSTLPHSSDAVEGLLSGQNDEVMSLDPEQLYDIDHSPFPATKLRGAKPSMWRVSAPLYHRHLAGSA